MVSRRPRGLCFQDVPDFGDQLSGINKSKGGYTMSKWALTVGE
jgi:hypothetical protein